MLSSKATLNTLAVAVNKTVAHHFSHLLYFTGLRGAKAPHGMTLVSHGDERPVWLMYETMRYLHQHVGGHYDWFFVMQDDTYARAEQVKALVSHLSIHQDIYLGRAEEFIGGEERARYCHGGFGYLLSRSLLLKLHPYLDSCRNEILSVRPDEWLGRCIVDYLGISCVSQHQVLLLLLGGLRGQGGAGRWVSSCRHRPLVLEYLLSFLVISEDSFSNSQVTEGCAQSRLQVTLWGRAESFLQGEQKSNW